MPVSLVSVRPSALLAALLLVGLPLVGLRAADSADDHQVDARGGTVRQNAQMDDGNPKPFAADKNATTTRESHLLHLMEKTVTPPPGFQFRPFKGSELGLDANITNSGPNSGKPLQLPIYVRIPKYVDILSAPDCCFNVDVTDIEGMIHALRYNSQASPMEGPGSITVSGIMPEEDHAGQFPLRIEGNLTTPSGRGGEDPHWAAKVGSIQILVDRNHVGGIDGKDNLGKRLRFADRNHDNKFDDLDNPRDDMPGAVFLAGYGLEGHPQLGDRIKALIKYPIELKRGVLRLRVLDEHMPSNVEVTSTDPAPSRNRHVRIYKDGVGGAPLTDDQLQWDLSASPVVPTTVYLDYASDEIAIIRLTFLRQATDTTPVMTDEVKVAHFSNGVGSIDSLQPSVGVMNGLGGVELMSGNLHLDAVVRAYLTPAFGPSVTLSYNHLDGIETGLGRGWRTTYDQRVFDNTYDRVNTPGPDGKITNDDRKDGDLVVLLDGSGRKWPFTWNETDKKYVSTDVTGLRKATVEPLKKIEDRTDLPGYNADDLDLGYKVLLNDNLIRWFDRDGYLVQLQTLRKERVSIVRGVADGANPWRDKCKAITAKDQYSREEPLTAADFNGAVVDPVKRTLNKIGGRSLGDWDLLYDSQQRLETCTIRNPSGGAGPDGATGAFHLSGGDRLAWKIGYDPGTPSDPSQSLSKVSTITIPYQSKVVKVAYTPTTRLSASTKAVVTGPFGGDTVFDNIVPEAGAWQTRSLPGVVTVTTARVVDKTLRRLTSETTGHSKITYLYDDLNNQTEVAVAGGTTTQWTWKSFGIEGANLLETSTLVGAGGQTKYSYNTSDKAKGLVETVTDPCGVKTTYAYKPGTAFVQTETVNARTPWTNAVDQWGNSTLRTSPMGRTTTITWFEGGKWGLAEKTTDFLTFASESHYDARHRKIAVILPTGGLVVTDLDPLGRSTVVTDALQTKTTTTYDALGRMTQIETTAGGAVTEPAPSAPTTYAYIDGEQTRVTAMCAGVFMVDRLYDLQGRTITDFAHRVLSANKGPVECPVTTTAFTLEGWPESITDARQQVTKITYDTAGRPTIVKSPLLATVTTQYNTAGWISSIEDADHHTTKYTSYDPCGRVTTVVNPMGGSVTTAYDLLAVAGDSVTTTPSVGTGDKMAYDQDGLPVESTDRFGQKHSYAYVKPVSIFGLPLVAARVTVTQKVKPTGASAAVDVVRTTFLSQGVVAGSAVSGVSMPVAIAHDANGASTGVSNRFGGSSTIGLSQYGEALTSSVQQSGGVVAQTRATVTAAGIVAQVQSPLGNLTVPVTNAVTGDFATSTDSLTHAAADVQTTDIAVISRDPNGNILTWTDARKRACSASYDDDNRQVTLTAPDQRVTTTRYTPGGHPRQVDVTVGGTLVAHSEIRYNELNNVIYTKDIESHETSAEFDVFGLVQSRTVRGQSTTFLYNQNTRLLLVTTLPGYLTIQCVYDEYGRKTSETDPNFKVTTFVYDELDRLARIVHPFVLSYLPPALGAAAGARVAAIPAQVAYTESFTYDPSHGDLATATDMGGGVTTVLSRDQQGRPLSIFRRSGNTGMDPVTVTTTYDQEGNWKRRSLEAQSYVAQELDVRGRRTQFTASAPRIATSSSPASRGVEVAAAVPAAPLTPVVQTIDTTSYNDGSFLSKTAGGSTWQATLNDQGQLAKFSLGTTGSPGTPVTVGYNGSNRVDRLDLPGGVVRLMTYTPGGQMKTMTETVGPQQIVYANTYDPLTARLMKVTGPGYAQLLGYNAAGRLTLDERTGTEPWQKIYVYDNNGNRTSSVIQTGGESHLLTFEGGAIPVETTPQTGVWDTNQGQLRVRLGPVSNTAAGLAQIATTGRPTRLSAQVQLGATATFAGFQPRVNGNTRYHVGLLAAIDGSFTLVATVTKGAKQIETVLATSEPFSLVSRSATISMTQLPGSTSWFITCVESNVVISAVIGNLAADQFQIEARGPLAVLSESRFTEVGWQIGGSRKSRTLTYDALNRLRSIRGSEVVDYEYDPVGMVTAITTTATTKVTKRSFTYDALRRMTVVSQEVTPTGGAAKILFTNKYLYYGPTMIRAAVIHTPNLQTTYIADEAGQMSETTGKDTTTFARMGSTPLWQSSTSSGLFTFMQDGRGNVMGLVRDGLRLFGFTYDAFGVVTATDFNGKNTTVPSGPRYRGAYFDSATGEYLMGERFYQPETGTFLTEDPARAGGNWNSYAGGDPVNRYDPSGLKDIAYNGVIYDVSWDGRDLPDAELVDGGPSVTFTIGGIRRKMDITKLNRKSGIPTAPVAFLVNESGTNRVRSFSSDREAADFFEKNNEAYEQRRADNDARLAAYVWSQGAERLPGGGYGAWRGITSPFHDMIEDSMVNAYQRQGRLGMEMAMGSYDGQTATINAVSSLVMLPEAAVGMVTAYKGLATVGDTTMALRQAYSGTAAPSVEAGGSARRGIIPVRTHGNAHGFSIRDINPTGNDMNCAECAIRADALLAGRGFDVARAAENATELGQIERALGGVFDSATAEISPITQRALLMGPGARGIVFGLPRAGNPDAIGHYFNVVNQNGIVRYLDPQYGTAAELNIWAGFRVLWTTQ